MKFQLEFILFRFSLPFWECICQLYQLRVNKRGSIGVEKNSSIIPSFLPQYSAKLLDFFIILLSSDKLWHVTMEATSSAVKFSGFEVIFLNFLGIFFLRNGHDSDHVKVIFGEGSCFVEAHDMNFG